MFIQVWVEYEAYNSHFNDIFDSFAFQNIWPPFKNFLISFLYLHYNSCNVGSFFYLFNGIHFAIILIGHWPLCVKQIKMGSQFSLSCHLHSKLWLAVPLLLVCDFNYSLKKYIFAWVHANRSYLKFNRLEVTLMSLCERQSM